MQMGMLLYSNASQKKLPARRYKKTFRQNLILDESGKNLARRYTKTFCRPAGPQAAGEILRSLLGKIQRKSYTESGAKRREFFEGPFG